MCSPHYRIRNTNWFFLNTFKLKILILQLKVMSFRIPKKMFMKIIYLKLKIILQKTFKTVPICPIIWIYKIYDTEKWSKRFEIIILSIVNTAVCYSKYLVCVSSLWKLFYSYKVYTFYRKNVLKVLFCFFFFTEIKI